MASLSVITLTLNESANIAECLQSVSWANEIIVVDSGSSDGTTGIARKFTSHVLEVAWEGFGKTKNLALQHCTSDWVLWLDADERVTPGLAEEIQQLMKSDNAGASGYDVARRAYFLGRWIKHCGWYPSRVVRLFRRGKGRFTESHVHEGLIIDGPVGSLNGDLLHFTDPDLHHYFQKFNRYTSLAAKELHESGRTATLPDLVFRAPFKFVSMYILRLGFLDGVHGLVLSVLSSAYVFTKYAKLWELTGGAKRKEADHG